MCGEVNDGGCLKGFPAETLAAAAVSQVLFLKMCLRPVEKFFLHFFRGKIVKVVWLLSTMYKKWE